MMNQSVVTRTQRRTEKKLTVWITILIVAVAGVSFFLGYTVGQRDGEIPGLANGKGVKPKLPMAAQVPPPPKPEPVPEKTEETKLTFYDNLPKGDQAPLGSGINLPPEQKSAKKSVEEKVVPPEPEAVKEVVIPAEPPVADAQGAFVVQVASFRTAEDADKLVTRLGKLGLTPFVERADLGDKGIWHRVLSGPYTEKQSAEQVALQLKEKERLSALVKRR